MPGKAFSEIDQIYVANDSFSTVLDGQPITVSKGMTRVRHGHPLLAGREQMFDPIEVHFDVEQATDRPGEKRGARGA